MVESRVAEDVIALEIDRIKSSFLEQFHKGVELISISAPHILYLTDSQSKLFEAATSGSVAYQACLDVPIAKLIDKVSTTIISNIGGRAHFIDLGPGYPSKSLSLIDAMTENDIAVTYYAVDISAFFLERAVSAVHQRNLPAHSLRRRFEEIEPILDQKLASKSARVIFLGLTYCNFDPAYICEILASITRQTDYCIVCSQSSELVKSDRVLSPYKTDAVRSFAFEILRLIGIPEHSVSYEPEFSNGCVYVCFKVIKVFELSGVPVGPGVKIVTAKSRRNTKEETTRTLEGYFRVREVQSDALSGVSIFLLQGALNAS